MKMSIKKRLKKIFYCILSIALVCSGLFCAAVRISNSGIDASFDIIAAQTAMPTGTAQYSEPPEISETVTANTEPSVIPEESSHEVSCQESSAEEKSNTENIISQVSGEQQTDGFQASSVSDDEIEKYKKAHEGEEEYPVNEFNTTLGNESYENIQVKNASSADIDIKDELTSELGFQLENTDEPQVLIYHTHTSESYLRYDTGYFYESYYPRSSDKTENVCATGEELAKQLSKEGIKAIHDTTVHDDPSYSGAYDRSFATVSKYLEKYPSIKIVLDIHRDGIGTDTEKSKPVFTYNGRQGAQVMILAGYNYDGSDEFKDWEYNLRFALKIQDTASKDYPDMMRPLYFADFMYNMNINTGSLLIEVGSESNTVEEARYSAYLLAKAIAKSLKAANKKE